MMGFAGMERDTVTGMNLAVNRVQNPGTGRWTSQDPLGFAAGDADLYGYANNNGVGDPDPSGLWPQPPSEGVGLRLPFSTSLLPKPYRLPTTAELCENPKIQKWSLDILELSDSGPLNWGEYGVVVYQDNSTGNLFTGYYFRHPPGQRNRISPYRQPHIKGATAVCFIHSHPATVPPAAPSKPSPDDSPLDPDDSNLPLGVIPYSVPRIIIGPDGQLYMIGPESSGGSDNQNTRLGPMLTPR